MFSRYRSLCYSRILFGILLSAVFISGCDSSSRNPKQSESMTPSKNANGRNDSWGYVGAGGGGAMFNPSVSPFNPDYAFVACDMTGSFVTHDGGQSWRMFNLRDHVRFFVFDPSDSNVVYANSIGLFKSIDRGNTWSIIYPSEEDINRIISKGDHASEIIVTKDSTTRHVLSFAVDPADSKKLYAVISIDTTIGFYSSNDGGIRWINERKLDHPVKNIFVNPSSPPDNRTLYLTTASSILIKENGSWRVNQGPAGIKSLTTFSGGFDRQQNKFIIYAISGKSYFNPDDDISGIFYTDNAGETWENRQETILQLKISGSDMPEWRNIATSSSHPSTLYVSYDGLKVHPDTTSSGVAKSEDYGRTWKLTWQDRLAKHGYKVSENFKDGWINERFGPGWGENPFSIGVSPMNPNLCYATDFGRTVKTTDGGTSWQQVYTIKKEKGGWYSRGLEVTTGYGVVFDPFDSGHVFITNTDIGLMESNDGAKSWVSATQNNGVPRSWSNSTYWLTFDPDVKGKAWAAMSGVHDLPRPKMWRRNSVAGFEGGILETENSGRTWREISTDIGEGAVTHILLDRSSNIAKRILFASVFGKGVYKSVDGGKTWQKKNNGIEGKEPFAWRIIKQEGNGTLYLIVCRRSDDGSIGNEMNGAVYRSIDGAESWAKLILPPGTNAPTSIAVNPANPDQLIMSAWGRLVKGRFSPDTGGGIFISNDNGSHWKPVLQNDQHIHDISFDAARKTWYACGFNGSAYRSENGETWNRIKGYNFKWGKRVEPDPRNRDKIFIITFGGGVWYGPAKGDESAVEDIISDVFAR